MRRPGAYGEQSTEPLSEHRGPSKKGFRSSIAGVGASTGAAEGLFRRVNRGGGPLRMPKLTGMGQDKPKVMAEALVGLVKEVGGHD